MIDLAYQTSEAVTLLNSLVGIPSPSGEEEEAADFVQNYFEGYGIMTERAGNNVWSVAPSYDSAKPTILLDAHIDTVRPGSSWKHQPYTPKSENGRIYGLGTADALASAASMFQVFRFFLDRPRLFNLVFLASAEEENFGSGGVSMVLPHLPKIDLGIVGAPTMMRPATAEKGLMVIDVSARGKAGHAAKDEGVNAIYEIMDDISWIRQHHFEKVSPLLGEVNMTVTRIEADGPENIVPDRCSMVVDVRSNEHYTNEEILREIKSHIRGEVSVRNSGAGSTHISANHPVVVRACELGLEPFGSPVVSNQARMPFPTVKLGPGDHSRSHKPDEYIEIEEITQAIDIYIKLLDGLEL